MCQRFRWFPLLSTLPALTPPPGPRPRRYRYLGLPMLDSEAVAVAATYKEENGGRLRDTPGAGFADSAREDAFGTLMGLLYSRIEPVRAGGP